MQFAKKQGYTNYRYTFNQATHLNNNENVQTTFK